MDILIHTLSGTATATAIAGTFGKNNTQRFQIVTLGAFAGALPDFDAISLWSKFDSTIGSWLSLPKGKEIYFGKLWYSHHAFLHSLLAACLLAITIFAFLFLKRHFQKTTLPSQVYFIYPITGLLSFCSHLLGDMPTPASVWGGVAFWFPVESYTGGWGKIWWWNNYDIFLILLSCTLLNLILFRLKKSRLVNIFAPLIFILSFLFITYQVNHRDFDFGYTGHTSKFQDYE